MIIDINIPNPAPISLPRFPAADQNIIATKNIKVNATNKNDVAVPLNNLDSLCLHYQKSSTTKFKNCKNRKISSRQILGSVPSLFRIMESEPQGVSIHDIWLLRQKVLFRFSQAVYNRNRPMFSIFFYLSHREELF